MNKKAPRIRPYMIDKIFPDCVSPNSFNCSEKTDPLFELLIVFSIFRIIIIGLFRTSDNLAPYVVSKWQMLPHLIIPMKKFISKKHMSDKAFIFMKKNTILFLNLLVTMIQKRLIIKPVKQIGGRMKTLNMSSLKKIERQGMRDWGFNNNEMKLKNEIWVFTDLFQWFYQNLREFTKILRKSLSRCFKQYAHTFYFTPFKSKIKSKLFNFNNG
ncbi:hypothetical protein BpHYR1_047612 [Brachionus plicatilis]|uniref:Uncharacterized protein n=1 Tax=Brachionus plicatilis TaxID=10195 RepID=A0A3M7SR56_BRAPC|nr:hypothetical protein BpHYR1_047612 [Brachionus plicatilis]